MPALAREQTTAYIMPPYACIPHMALSDDESLIRAVTFPVEYGRFQNASRAGLSSPLESHHHQIARRLLDAPRCLCSAFAGVQRDRAGVEWKKVRRGQWHPQGIAVERRTLCRTAMQVTEVCCLLGKRGMETGSSSRSGQKATGRRQKAQG